MITKQRIVGIGVLLSLFNLLAAALIGLLLRFHKIFPQSWLIDRYWTHAHSHDAFLGWAFIAFIITAFALQMPDREILNRWIFRLLIGLQISVMGMLAAFPFTGYGLWSIFFSTIHMGLSAALIILYFKNADSRQTGVLYMRTAMVFYLVSGLGPLSLGPIMVNGLKGTPIYEMAVYFYLHFQYNGWFTMAIIGLLYQNLDERGFAYNRSLARWNVLPFAVSIVLTLALSAAAFAVPRWLIWSGFAGTIIVFPPVVILLRQGFTLKANTQAFPEFWAHLLVAIAMISWIIKLFLQVLNGVPAMAGLVFLRESIMFYLHLTFLGMMTCFIFGLWIQEKFISASHRWAKAGFVLFLAGVLFSEAAIGLKVFTKYLTYELYSALNLATLVASFLIFTGLVFIVCFAFIIPQLRSKAVP